MITAYVPRPSSDRPTKQSECLRLIYDSIMCDIEFCASATEIVGVVKDHFDRYIKEAEMTGN